MTVNSQKKKTIIFLAMLIGICMGSIFFSVKIKPRRLSVVLPLPPTNTLQVSAIRTKKSTRLISEIEPVRTNWPSAAWVRTIVGLDAQTANSYESRARAVQQLSNNLMENDVWHLLRFVVATNDCLSVEHVAALKSDVLNMLRDQDVPSAWLIPVLCDMFYSNEYPHVILDYCIQHLGAMQNSCEDPSELQQIRTCLRRAATGSAAYAGTALYALADDRRASTLDLDFLRQRTLEIIKDEHVDPLTRISAIQLAGQKHYWETLADLREILKKNKQDVVLQMVAIGSIGFLGTETDLQSLRMMMKPGDYNPRLRYALESAIMRISKREKK